MRRWHSVEHKWACIRYTHPHTTLQHRVRGTVGLLNRFCLLLHGVYWSSQKSIDQAKARDKGPERVTPCNYNLMNHTCPLPRTVSPRKRDVCGLPCYSRACGDPLSQKRSQCKQTSIMIRHPRPSSHQHLTRLHQ